MANNIRCSIETEPETLNQLQLNHAREVAADIVQRMEPNEASALFTDQLRFNEESRPLVPVNHDQAERKTGGEKQQLHAHDQPVGGKEMKVHIIGRSRLCACTTENDVESPD
ncbi:hypothetical protein I3843_02G124700 [Carya illinoinensis]|uniref:Uncharacterized protein n=1 Tax=Carya illinoinensis TaxID=32201 RepID=A0A922FW62_CARIL|nr:hypothetical protein I3842_02G143700 [Carya illinoinensis]KAG7992369.1 hypothetical protein I3843_02G124700 [Carya illinoinensis]